MLLTYLPKLYQQGITARRLNNGRLWLEPRAAITDTIRRVVNKHKAEIIAELQVCAGDPRQDLHEDSPLWARLLSAAERNTDLWGALHGFRCYGARLWKHNNRLSLRYDPELEQGLCGWPDASAYERDYQAYIEPHQPELTNLLQQERIR